MRLAFALFLSIAFCSCRTTKKQDERFFADGKSSKDVVVGVKAGTPPPMPTPVPSPDPFPQPDSIEKGAFHVVCAARNQLSSAQALTVEALLAGTHQNNCAAAESWLRNPHNKSLRLDTEELVELQTLALLQNYQQIADVYIKTAKGIDTVCPLGKDQTCHWIKPDFE